MELWTYKTDGTPVSPVLVIHSWWGLSPSFSDFASSLASKGFIVGLSDLFDGRTARTESEARALRRRPRRVPTYRTLEADLTTLRGMTGGGNRKIGVVGFSMGGHWAVWLSQRPEYGIGATVLYYAARAGDFSRSSSSILAHFAGGDPWVSHSARRSMEKAISRAGLPYVAHDYPEAGHWFAECDRRDSFRPSDAALAFNRTTQHLRNALGNQETQD